MLRDTGGGVDIESFGVSLYINSQDSPTLLNPYGGNVGIGTEGPNYPLDVNGDTNINGNLYVYGSISAGTKDFKIDHPLDPTNKYLYHASVESSEMMNIYTGNLTLDQNGEGWVVLPAWFEALNRDFRYQLTPLGAAFTPYVAEEIANGRFKIAGLPGKKVSWQVTCVRQDAWANANPLVVEQEKSGKEKGTYLHPEVYGQAVK
jgi:hypothetical protein